MDKDQKAAWLEAQKVVVPEDLVAAAKQQLEFLAAVDRRRWLYDGPLLDRAVYRYKVFWLPMLAKHCEHGAEDDFLYVPLDCEWIWHCHRLNPVQYKKDCEEIFGRILDNHNVISSLQEKSKNKMTEKWSELYPEEPFEFSCDYTVSKETSSEQHGVASRLTYDLISAVKRQSSFCYQVSRPCMQDRRYLEEAAARYKGFLNLIKINHDRSIKQFTVPTYDIDLMWHSHQLHPLSYSNDMINLLGKVLEHDDTDSNRSKGKKLDVGFEKTTKQWEDTYGSRYWKAGAMYRGNSPSPVTSIPYFSSHPVVNETIIDKSLKQSMIVQVLLEIVEIKNLPNSEKSNLYVLFAKKKSDLFFYGGGPLSIQSVSGKKHRASFTCEPTGELTLTLMSRWKPKIATLARMIGTTSISLEDLNNPSSELSTEKWFELKPHSGNVDSKPIYLRVAVSFTVPVLAPFELRMFKSLPVSTNTCLFPLRGKEKFKGWTRFLDHNGEEVIRLQIRNLEKMEGKNVTSLMREVVGIPRESRNPWQLAKYADNNWSLNNYNISLVENITGQDGHIFEIKGDFMMKLFLGKKLEYEPKCCEEQNGNANEFITLVEFSAENPYGKAVALFDMKAGFIEVNETKFVLLGVLLAFILKYANKMQRNNVLLTSKEDAEVTPSSNEVEHVERKTANGIACAEYPGKVVDSVSDKLNALNGQNSGGCGGTCSGVCGGGCGKMSGGCGGCGGGCGNMSARCGGGACGGKCGGGGCGGGCGNMSARCGGGGCGGKCGGGGCGGGCGNMSARCGGGGGCGGKCGGGGCGGCGSTATGNMPSAGGGGCGGCGNMVDGSTMTDAVCDGYGGGDFGQYGANHVIPNNNHAEGYAGSAVTV